MKKKSLRKYIFMTISFLFIVVILFDVEKLNAEVTCENGYSPITSDNGNDVVCKMTCPPGYHVATANGGCVSCTGNTYLDYSSSVVYGETVNCLSCTGSTPYANSTHTGCVASQEPSGTDPESNLVCENGYSPIATNDSSGSYECKMTCDPGYHVATAEGNCVPCTGNTYLNYSSTVTYGGTISCQSCTGSTPYANSTHTGCSSVDYNAPSTFSCISPYVATSTDGNNYECTLTCSPGYHVATANGGCVSCTGNTYLDYSSSVVYGGTVNCLSCTGSTPYANSTHTGCTATNPYGGGPGTTYTITADANGGKIKTPITTGWTMISNSDNKKATKDVSSGSTYGTLPEVTKTDDTLKEWNTKADGTGIKVTSSTTAGETRTIYAIWNSVVTTITGITISPKPAEVEVGKTIQLTAVVTPSTANQTVNWRSSDPNIASVDNNGVVTGKVVGTVTITATTQDGTMSDTAQVTVVAAGSGTTTHNITFDCNGGTGNMTPVSVNFGQTITLPTNACVKTGYVFSGWNTSASGNGTSYADGATIDYTLNEDLTLIAQWTRNSNTYVIHYDANDANGGTGTMTDTVATVDVEGTLKANTFKYSGHTFDGWKAYYKDSNGNWTPLKKDNKEVELKNKAKFTNLMGPNEEEVTLFAQWKVVNPKTGIVTPTAIIGGLLLISAFGYYLVKKKNIVLE